MVTSANSGEGKTVTCINMGFTFARALNHTVFLVDCDFKGKYILVSLDRGCTKNAELSSLC